MLGNALDITLSAHHPSKKSALGNFLLLDVGVDIAFTPSID